MHTAIRSGGISEVVAKGGRGSGKSSYLSIELVWQLLRRPDCHAVVLRKVGGTLRNSVYNQIVWAIGELGCAGYFRCTVSPMECTYLPTGQKILFFGLDDPGKLKSLKLPFGSVGICWFEELDQFDGPEEVRNVEQTVLRGGSWALTLKSFNPPAMARSWVNRYALEQRPGKLVHHSTYRDLPRALLGERFWEDAAHLERTNPAAYRHEYGGEVVGSGAAVFDNLQLRTLAQDELDRCDRVYHGVDWGWYPDPWAYNAVCYDAARRTLIIYDELTRRRTPNRETARLLAERGLTDPDSGPLTADAAEPKSCADYRAVDLIRRWQSYVRGGAVCTSMEESILFSVGSSLGIRTASILVSATNFDGSVSKRNSADVYPTDSIQKPILSAIEALRRIIRQDKG